MKRFLLTLIILSAFVFVVFYIGWTQIKVKADSVGVVFSKTGGLSEEPVLPGEFTWYKEFLLPTNAILKQFQITPINTIQTVSGELPSASYYTDNSQDYFSYSFTFSISLTISPQALISLIKLNKITEQKDLEQYLLGAAASISQLACDYYLKKAQENPSFRPESVRRDDLIKAIQSYKDFPEVEISVFALTNSKIPDYNLYYQIKNKTIDNQQSEDEAL